MSERAATHPEEAEELAREHRRQSLSAQCEEDYVLAYRAWYAGDQRSRDLAASLDWLERQWGRRLGPERHYQARLRALKAVRAETGRVR